MKRGTTIDFGPPLDAPEPKYNALGERITSPEEWEHGERVGKAMIEERAAREKIPIEQQPELMIAPDPIDEPEMDAETEQAVNGILGDPKVLQRLNDRGFRTQAQVDSRAKIADALAALLEQMT